MMQQYALEKGWMGEASAAVGLASSLLGLSGPPPPKPPDPNQLDKLLQRVKDATSIIQRDPGDIPGPECGGADPGTRFAPTTRVVLLNQMADFSRAPPPPRKVAASWGR